MAKKKKQLAEVFHYDLYGKRQEKYDFLDNNSINSIDWSKLENRDPEFFFVQKDWEVVEQYEKGFSVNDLFVISNVGFTAARDNSLIHIDKSKVVELLYDLEFLDIEIVRAKHRFGNDSRDWILKKAIDDIISKQDRNITKISYRPFDFRYTHISRKTKGFFSYPRWEIMQHFYNRDNIGLLSTRLNRQISLSYFWLSSSIVERHILDSAGDSTSLFPLYLYPDQEEGIFTEKDISTSSAPKRKPNLNLEIVEQIAKKIGLEFVNEKDPAGFKNPQGLKTFAPIDILEYIYAVLHSPTYREKYKEFLKIDFPRVPYPKSKEIFWQLVKLGGEIRQIHLLESPKVEEYITSYPIDGDNTITTKIGKKDWELIDNDKGRIWINETQYFDNIPLVAWEFYIGGYQPAQKWLKDRKGRTLNFEDILHYHKIIVALTETDRLMKQIDKIEIEN